jgi:ATP synthase protein I
MVLGFRAVADIGRFLDSPTGGQYGPRGFEDGRIFLDSLTASRCRKTWPGSMAEDHRNESKDSIRSAEEAALSARLRRLGERLGQKTVENRKDEAESSRDTGQNASALARGFRLSTELVAGVLVGAFIGWALDKWLGTTPWGMMVFLLLGFAAGVVNVIRAAGVSSGPGSGR